jgi:fatty-acyl-CoA synthase
MGKPKGVLLSERNLLAAALPTCEILRLSPDDRVLDAVPFFTIFGAHVVVTTIAAGATLVMQKHFDRNGVLDLIEQERLSVIHGVPTMFELLMRSPSFGTRDLSSCRTGIVAGSPVPRGLIDRVRPWCDVQVAYGLTETGPTISMTRFQDPADVRQSTVGRAIEGVELKVLPTEVTDGGEREAGGELVVRGPNVMLGYYRMPGETAKSMTVDGFFRTGDLATIDSLGHVRIVGRRKEMIIRGGHNIYPRELEDVLRTHPAVNEVCVIGVPDAVLGEVVCACVVMIEGAIATTEDLVSYVAEQVAEYKVPDLVHFFDALPRTQRGKVKHHELVEVVGSHRKTTGHI